MKVVLIYGRFSPLYQNTIRLWFSFVFSSWLNNDFEKYKVKCLERGPFLFDMHIGVLFTLFPPLSPAIIMLPLQHPPLPCYHYNTPIIMLPLHATPPLPCYYYNTPIIMLPLKYPSLLCYHYNTPLPCYQYNIPITMLPLQHPHYHATTATPPLPCYQYHYNNSHASSKQYYFSLYLYLNLYLYL